MAASIIKTSLTGFSRFYSTRSKFTSIVTAGWHREETLRSGYVYQIYAYLFSQVGCGDLLADHASGLLLHPAIGEMVDEEIVIQGHSIRFATVDLTASAADIRRQLLNLCASGGKVIKLV
jgi:5-methylcytosine-specific restriction enzyme subunit McrC